MNESKIIKLSERLIILDSLIEFDISDILNEFELFLETLKYDIKIVELKSEDICNFISKDEYLFELNIFNKIISFNRYLEELEENENLVIIVNGCFFNRFDYLFINKESNNITNILHRFENVEDYFKNFCDIFSLNKQKEFITKEAIQNFKYVNANCSKLFLAPENKKSFYKMIGSVYDENILEYHKLRDTVLIDSDMSKKGKFIKLMQNFSIYGCFKEFKNRIKQFLDVNLLKDLSTFYDSKKHGTILSICRDLDKPLSFNKCISTIKMKHVSPLQFFDFSFKLKGIPRTVLIELERYRTINAMCCESTRYVLKKMDKPEEELFKGMNNIVKNIAIESLQKIKENLGSINDDELKLALPEGFSTNLYMNIDARNIIHLFSERLSRGAHKDFRLLVYMMILELIEKNDEYINILSLVI